MKEKAGLLPFTAGGLALSCFLLPDSYFVICKSLRHDILKLLASTSADKAEVL